MAVQTVNTVDRSGTVDLASLEVTCASGGDSFPNTGAQYVEFNNTSGGAIVVTEVFQTTIDGQATSGVSRTFSIAAGARRLVGPFPTATYNDGNGRMNFTYSVNPPTGLKMAVFQNTTS